MRYLVLLLLLVGCGVKPIYKVGDCIRVTTDTVVGDFLIKEIIKDKYVISSAFKVDGVPIVLGKKWVFSFEAIQEQLDTIKIECSEVE